LGQLAQKTIKPGTVAGHEFVGRVVAVGSNVTGHKVGDLVSAEATSFAAIAAIACRAAPPLRQHAGRRREPGRRFRRYVACACAEYLALRSEKVPLELYAIFDPVGNAAHTALSYDLVGEES